MDFPESLARRLCNDIVAQYAGKKEGILECHTFSPAGEWAAYCRSESSGAHDDMPEQHEKAFWAALMKHAPPGVVAVEMVESLLVWTYPDSPAIVINDGAKVRYWESFMTPQRAESLFTTLKANIQWEQEKVKIFGRIHEAARLTATYGNHDKLSYGFAGVRKGALPWTDELRVLKDVAEKAVGCTLNYAVLNYYRDGSDHIGYHSDKVADLVKDSPIVSISLGATRDFVLKKKETPGVTTTIALAPGSMLTMEGKTQQYYQHCVPERKGCKEGRINITFRHVREPSRKQPRRDSGEESMKKKPRLDLSD
jgi:alkylated DNA repair dioxygenase AlkB